MSNLLRDLRYALRQYRQSPGLAVAAIVCIALGIGANTAVFSFANSLLMYEPPIRDPDRLVRLFVDWESGLKFGAWSYPDFADFRERGKPLEALIADTPTPLHLSTEGRNVRVWGSIVSGNYFSDLGVEPALGRGFTPEEDQTPGTHPVTVIGYSFWQNHFGSDPGALGETVLLNSHPFTVIGVAPEGFHGTNVGFGPDLWVPMMMIDRMRPRAGLLEARGSHWIAFVFGRLEPGVTVEQASESANAFMAELTELYPASNTGTSITVLPEAESNLHPFVRDAFVAFIGVMFGVVGLILLLACANVAGLLLARSAARHKEVGIRLALGAGRGRLLRQLLTESAVLALLAGGVGLLLGFWLVRLVGAFEPPSDLPMRWDVALDVNVLIFTSVAAAATGLLFGLMPALQATRQDLVSSLKETSSGASGKSSLARRGLVVFQVALSLVLLIGAGLAVRSLANVADIDLGFEPDNLLVATIDLSLQGYDDARGQQFQRQLKERLGALPGVEVAALGELIPLNFMMNQNGVRPEGYEVPEGQSWPTIDTNVVDTDYFAAMGIPVLRGRGFTEADGDAPPVIVINSTFAERFWPGQTPIGKQVRTSGQQHEVIGVVPDGKYFSIGEDPKPYFYRSLNQYYRGGTYLHVRTAGDPSALLEPVRREIEALDPTLPISGLQTMHTALSFALLPARLAAGVVSVFAGLALLLAAIGLYGVIAYSVSQGTRDIGIRMALGARANDVLQLILRQGMALTAIGLALGLAAGLTLTRLARAVLYGVSPTDVLSYIVASVVLAGVAFLASFIPARRATHVDPIVALREE